ncbi:MAG: hypothetical protein HKP48_07520 [Winogradskyella sp.]|uniref:hypothetical protein n=1 Tax=Winogradskyella sp. TaxID=1883156 RepID=UPI0017FED0AC|nr:hypothetical protein [Winogradskyella sp.]MBT8244643.1 hypothetical protein [Winogradskyella sp.]NNK23131.1 hypothetical protein [Winogradskyella sp.]
MKTLELNQMERLRGAGCAEDGIAFTLGAVTAGALAGPIGFGIGAFIGLIGGAFVGIASGDCD